MRLLGPVAAAAGGVELALGGMKQRGVFALLALNSGHVVPLDRLVDELWSDEPPSRATLSLQSYVARLRRVLAAVPEDDGEPPLIVTRPPGWMLTLDPQQVDVTRFERLISTARRGLENGGAGVAVAGDALEEALALWTGEPLAGLEGMRFAREEASRLTELRLDATELLLQAQLDLGHAAAVAPRAAQFVGANPYRERAWCILMLALYRSGRQSEALAAAARLRRTLADELGVDPSLEVRRLEAQILRQDPGLVWSDGDVLRSGEPAPLPVQRGGGGHDGDSTLIGRADVLSTVDVALAEARAGRGRLLVLHAPAGLGKSSILHALEERAAAGGGVVLRGDCSGAGQAPALWPWVSIVRALTAGRTPPEGSPTPAQHEVARPGGTAQALLQPDTTGVGSTVGDGPSSEMESALSRTRLFRAVIEALAAARAAEPVAVLMDDLHWADTETVTLLTLAVDELVPRGVLFAVAVRSDEPGADRILAHLDGVRRGSVQRVPLTPLAPAEVAAVVRNLSGADADPDVVTVIGTRTAGNPLFVCELVRLLISERRLDADGVRATLPQHVHDVLRRRLDRLPQQTLTVLTVIAVAGGPTRVDLLADVTGLDVDGVLDACEAAALTGLLVDDTQHPGAFVLSHDLVRQTLEHSLSTARRLRLHARIAEAVQAHEPMTPPDIVDVARHLTLAAPVVGPAAAVPFLVAASDDALSRYAHDQAERHLRTALDLISQVRVRAEREALEGPVRGRLTVLLLTVRGSLATDFDSGAEITATPDAEDAIGWLGNAIQATVTGHAPLAADAATVVLAGEFPPVTRFSAHFVKGFASHLTGAISSAHEEFEAAEGLAAQGVHVQIPGVFDGPVVIAAEAALVAHIEGDEPRADELLTLAKTRAVGSLSALVTATQHHAWLAAMRGDAVLARQHASECRILADRLDYAAYGNAAELVSGWADAMLGDATGADRADAVFARYLATGLRMLVPLYLLLRAEAHAASGHPSRARQLIRESRAVRAETGEVCSSPRLLAWAALQMPEGD